MQIRTITNIKTLHMKLVVGLLLILSVLATNNAFAAKPVYSGGKERAAIRGYDPVAYFTENKPVKGSLDFLFEYNGAKWLFSNQQNLDVFIANPTKYAPQYGGYCAYAVSNGRTASIKPEYFTIYDDKLYLNYSKSVYNKWAKDKDNYIAEANSEWVKILVE